MKIKKPISLLSLLFIFSLLLLSGQAYALVITPDTVVQYVGYDNGQPDISGYVGSAVWLYTANTGTTDSPVVDEGPLSQTYRTSFSNSETDPTDADIEFQIANGSFAFVSWLLVKGGSGASKQTEGTENQIPSWYLFDLSQIQIGTDNNNNPIFFNDWTNTEIIELVGFWPGKNAISHVSLYGTAPVPEPATMLLLGTGLVGLASLGRKRFLK